MQRTNLYLWVLLIGMLTFVTTTSCFARNQLFIFAAASTRDAVDAVIKEFSNSKSYQISGVYGSTAALARQIIQGAPASLFLSANVIWMNEVKSHNLVMQQSQLAQNRLVLISPTNYAKNKMIKMPSGIAHSLGKSRLAVAETTAVPAGIYARQAMQNLGIWNDLKKRLAPSTNVRAALMLVERAEAPLGVVYKTDALASRKVKILWTFPNGTHEPIVYPLALLKHAVNNNLAKNVFAFFNSYRGKKMFFERGFEAD